MKNKRRSSRTPELICSLAIDYHIAGDGTVQLGPARIVTMPRYVELLREHLRHTPPGARVRSIEVRHDADCAHWRGRPCDCGPDIVELGR
jgi:hypothetical protein